MTALLLCLAALCPQETSITRTYDLRTIASGAAGQDDHEAVRPRLPLFSIDEIYFAYPGPFDESELEAEVDPRAIVEGIIDAIDAFPGAPLDDYDTEDFSFQITGDEGAHDLCAQMVRALEDHQCAQILVEAFRVDRETLRGTPAAILNAAEASEIAEHAADAPRHIGWARWGRTQRISNSSAQQYLQSYFVEVNQFQASADPSVNRVHIGLDLGIRVDRSVHGAGLIVHAWGQNSALRDRMRRTVIPAYDDVVVEHPVVDTYAFYCSGVVEPGGALVVDAGDPDGEICVVRFLGDVSPRAVDDPAIDVGELTVPFLRTALWGLPVVTPSRGLDYGDPQSPGRVAPWTADRSSPGDVLERLSGDAVPVPSISLGSCAVVAVAPERRTTLRDEVRLLARSQHTATIEFTFAVTEVAPATLARAVTDRAALRQLCDDAASTRVGAVLSHDTLELMAGTATTHVSDQDTYIAQGAHAGNPIVRQVFDGTILWCSPIESSADAITAWIGVVHQQGFADPRTIDTFVSSPAMTAADLRSSPEVFDALTLKIPLELAKTRPVQRRTLARLVPDRWEIVAAQPFDGDDDVQLIAVKARVVGP